MRFASQTTVAADRSRAEIEKTLSRYGATRFVYAWDGPKAVIAFEMKGKRIRFVLPLPDRTDPAFSKTATGRTRRDPEAGMKVWEQSTRQKWRALLLVVKAKLEAVESGICSFEQEFLSFMVLPGGATIGQVIIPDLDDALAHGVLPPLLPEHDFERTTETTR